MTHETVPSAEGPHDLLMTVRDLTRQVRIAQRRTWFPLLVLAVTTLLAIPVYRYAPNPRVIGTCHTLRDGSSICAGVNAYAYAYWLVAAIVAYAVIAGFYIRRSRERGVGTPIRPYVIVGIVLAVVSAAATAWLAFHPLAPLTPGPIHVSTAAWLLHGLATPLAAIGLALLVLARVERSPALLAYGLVYVAVVLAQGYRVIHSHSPWFFLPYLLVPAALLLAGSAGFGLFRPDAERSAR